MVQYNSLAPGVHVREVDVIRTVTGVPVNVSGTFGTSQRGPDDKMQFVFSFDDYELKYGGFYGGSYLPYLVRGFFEQGGTALKIGRVTGSGAAKSSGTVNAQGGAAATIDLDGKYYGEYGDNLRVTFERVKTTIAVATTAVDTEIEVASVASFEVGDAIIIDDGTNTYEGLVVEIDAANSLLKLSLAVGAIFAIGVEVKTSTSHRAKTFIVEGFDAGESSVDFKVVSSAGLQVGDLIFAATGDISGNYMFTEMRITAINGSYITADVVNEDNSTTTAMPVDAPVVVQGFNMTVEYQGSSVLYEHISLEDENEINFVDVRFSGDQNESDLIEVTDANNVESVTWRILAYPGPVVGSLTGGADGSAPADTDYLGTTSGKTYKHGILLLDDNQDVNTFAIPGISTKAVISGCDVYAENHKMDYVGDCPLAADTRDELLEFRNLTLGIDTSYTAIYAPWHREENPLVPGQKVELPPSVRELGVYSSVTARKGVHKAPANEIFRNVIELVANFEEADYAVLNESGVNMIRTFPGRGIRVFGSRTLWSGRDGKQFVSVRRLANYVERSIANLAFEFSFGVISEDLWSQLQGEINAFLRSLWKAGMLYPRSDFNRAATVIINSTLNPEDVILAGRVRGKVAFNPPPPAEKIELDVALWQGGSTITEL